MRYLIVSDIHGNWEALSAVLADAVGAYDAVLNCGDMVGYGPDPNAVVDWCREHTPYVIRGNHDVTCATLENLEWFNPAAAKSARWTHEKLTPANREFLNSLPCGPLLMDGLEILHGSPADEDEYLVNAFEIEQAARQLERPIAFFGHTHIQGCYRSGWNGLKQIPLPVIDLQPECAYIVNPGSVGQPRDRDARAAYGLYDSERHFIELRRAAYDVPATQRKIIDAGLPDTLAVRLALGR